jgi:hypothetical protein
MQVAGAWADLDPSSFYTTNIIHTLGYIITW